MKLDPSMTFFHTGVVVDDLEESMAAMSETLGLSWAPPRTLDTPVWVNGEILPRKIRFTYSLQGPHFVELVHQIDPTAYMGLTGGPRIHHLGFHTDDIRAAAAALEARGYGRELNAIDDHGELVRASFHYNPRSPGMWIELISRELAEDLDSWLTSAAADQGVNYCPMVIRGSR